MNIIPPPPILPNQPSSNGGKGRMLEKDYCPNGDFSPSYYDGICENSLLQGINEESKGVIQ